MGPISADTDTNTSTQEIHANSSISIDIINAPSDEANANLHVNDCDDNDSTSKSKSNTSTVEEITNTNSLVSYPVIPCTQNDLLPPNRPNRTIYMDGVFDLFHYGHLQAIRHCAKLGAAVIIGITGDDDAANYKRPPIIHQTERIAIVAALKEVDAVVCPCPLIVTEEFMDGAGIDLVVHGFANEEDAQRQRTFFEVPIQMNKFRRIPYYDGQSTTDILKKIRSVPDEEDLG